MWKMSGCSVIKFDPYATRAKTYQQVSGEVKSNLPEAAHESLPFFTQGKELFGFYIRFKREEDAEEFCKTVEKMQNEEMRVSEFKGFWTNMEEIGKFHYKMSSAIGCHTTFMLWNRYRNISNNGVVEAGTSYTRYPCKVSATFVENEVLYGVKTG